MLGLRHIYVKAAGSLNLVWTAFGEDGQHGSDPHGCQSIHPAAGVQDLLFRQQVFAHALGRGFPGTPNLSPGRDINPAPAGIGSEVGLHRGKMGW